MQQPESSAYRRLLRLAALIWTALCGAYFFWEAFTYRGLFGRLAELQIANFGTYVPFLTYLVLFVLAAMPAWIIVRLLTSRADEELERAALLALRLSQAKRLRLLLATLGASALATALGFAAYTVWMLPSQTGNLQTIVASEFGTVPVKEGPARLVGGELGTMIFFGQDWFIGDDRMAFSPYRTSSNGDDLAHVFVQLEVSRKSELDRIVQRPSWSGILVEGGLPGTVRVLFNYVGVGISQPHYTLYNNEYSLKIRYWLQAIQWAMLAAFFLFLVALQTRTIKSLKKQRDVKEAEYDAELNSHRFRSTL